MRPALAASLFRLPYRIPHVKSQEASAQLFLGRNRLVLNQQMSLKHLACVQSREHSYLA
jgi:hypothetical protein